VEATEIAEKIGETREEHLMAWTTPSSAQGRRARSTTVLHKS
jgi:hypothetical protein